MNTDLKPFVCDCGRPAIRRTSNREPICARCSQLEKDLQLSIKANIFTGTRQTGHLIVPLPTYHAIEPPIAGETLKLLEQRLSTINRQPHRV